MKLMNEDEFIAYELKFYFMKNKLKEGEKLPSERDLACISGCGNRHFARCTCDDGMASPQKYLITCFAKEEL